MRIGVLGPLQVEISGRAVQLGGPVPRRLFALLVAHAGAAVSIDALVDVAWGPSPPPSAVKTVQSHVARLRAALADPSSAEGPIVTVRRSYQLAVPPSDVDANVFADLVWRARGAAAAGDLHEADGMLDAAFALWRGDPYGEFAGTAFGDAEARRLDEVRLVGFETRLDVGLAAGRDREVVATAEALCVQYPLRERFWAQLVLALYRCDRQADALDALRQVRHRLAEEIGADPGAALQTLEQRVLRHDPRLDRRTRSIAAPAVATSALEPERRLVSVLVAALGPPPGNDGWTDPERADAALREFRALGEDAIAAAGGTVLERTAEGVTAAFGLAMAHDDHVRRALDTALLVQQRCPPALGTLRAGVATGDVLRSASPAAPTTGEPVRLAAALCYAAGPDEILVGERSVADAGERFRFGPIEDRSPDRGPPLRAAAVTADRVREERRPSAGPGRVFVGRDDELNALHAAYRRVVEHRVPHFLVVLAEAGLGKSTLVAHFMRHLDAVAHGPVVYLGRCQPYGPGVTYGAFGEILRAHVPPEHDLGVLGLTLGLDTAVHLDLKEVEHRLHQAWVALAETMVEHRPGVLVIEDLHWAQPPLLDLLAVLIADVVGPLLIIGTARPEYHEAHPALPVPARRQQALWLDRLTDEQSAAMLDRLLGQPADEVLRRQLLGAAGGNPFFIEELLAVLVDRRALAATPAGQLTATGAHLPSLPDTVRSALAVRLDHLPPAARATLQAAAVAGEDFSERALVRLLYPHPPDLHTLLDRDLVHRLQAGRPLYSFKHTLVRQVTYELLPAGRRARLHAAYADVLLEMSGRELSGSEPDEFVPLLAHHYAAAADPAVVDLAWSDEPDALRRVRAQAVDWLTRTARLVLRRYAVNDAVALLRRAMELAPPPPVQAELWKAVADAYLLRADYPSYQAALQRVVDVSDDSEQQAEAYAMMANAVTTWGVVSPALPSDATVEEWLARALSLAAPESSAHTMAMLIRSSWFPERLAERAPEALAAAERGDDRENWFEAYGIQECLASIEHRYADALAWSMKALALLESDDPYEISDSYIHPIPPLMALGRFAEARDFASRNEAVAAAQSRADHVHALAWQIEVESIAGQWPTVVHLYQRIGPPPRDEIAHRVSTVRAALLCAAAHAYLGDRAESDRLERLAGRLAPGGDDRIAGPRIRLALARGDRTRVAELMAIAPRRLKPWAQWWSLELAITRLDAFAMLGDATAINDETAEVAGASPLVDAVILRAAAIVRRRPDLLDQAAEAFHRLDLPGQAAVVSAAR